MSEWLIKFIKGIFIGSGFILPGVSGGALAAVFGVYEKIIEFLAHITKNFKDNFMYLLPLGLGGITGVIIFSFILNYVLEDFEVQVLWLFVGCIIGTIPTLWKQAGIKGRKNKHYIIMLVSFILVFSFLFYGESLFDTTIQQNFFTWMMAGFLIALGIIVPGLSPSNLLIYFGMYKDMSYGISHLDFSIIIPLGIGGLLTILLLSKVVEWIFKTGYTTFYHVILGVVFSSTVMIIPRNVNYLTPMTIVYVLLLLVGVWIGRWMCNLEEKYKPDN